MLSNASSTTAGNNSGARYLRGWALFGPGAPAAERGSAAVSTAIVLVSCRSTKPPVQVPVPVLGPVEGVCLLLDRLGGGLGALPAAAHLLDLVGHDGDVLVELRDLGAEHRVR